MKQRIITSIFLITFGIMYLFIGAIYQEWNLSYMSYVFMSINTILLVIAVFEILYLRIVNFKIVLLIKTIIAILSVFLLWFPIIQDLHFEPYFIKNTEISRIEWWNSWMVFIVYAFFLFVFLLIAKLVPNLNIMDMCLNFIYVVILIFAFKVMNYLMLQKGYGFITITILLLITISNDSFAYLGGKFYGKHQLASKISPLKTWEGTFIGISSALVLSLSYVAIVTELLGYIPFASFFSQKTKEYKYIIYFLLFVFLSLVSHLGDLLFSIFKRHYKIKDFGSFLPGHGGLLDRIDSLVLVLVCIGFFIVLLQN